MSSKFEVSRPLRGGYIVSEALLRKCVQLVESFSGSPPNLSLTFRDGRTVNSTNPDEVFSDSFIQSTRISEIKIFATYFLSQRATITFIRKDGFWPIFFTAEGDRSATLTFEGDLRNELASSKQWYSPFVPTALVYMASTILFGSISILLLIISVNVPYKRSDPLGVIMETASIANLLILLMIMFSRFAFPSMIFNLGHGARRQNVRIATWSFVVFGVLTGILTIFLHDWLKTLF